MSCMDNSFQSINVFLSSFGSVQWIKLYILTGEKVEKKYSYYKFYMNFWLKEIVEESTIDSDDKILMVHPCLSGTWRQFPRDKIVWWMFDLRVPFGTILFLVYCVHLCPQLLELYCNHFSGMMSYICFMCSHNRMENVHAAVVTSAKAQKQALEYS